MLFYAEISDERGRGELPQCTADELDEPRAAHISTLSRLYKSYRTTFRYGWYCRLSMWI